ncbi:hypothetical protein [Rickettsiella endosymbiont of Dermanyssus gallinae]|uniref:hypothetical protein n=1 Tax=Rickettsiella endosymbiont of Dermanyssus gallinae TaxID=2856608 RepID=UPI001C533035|nr:hypothetical protein [Rickettsiella endosymbiont of Dermanyssus gallinae]
MTKSEKKSSTGGKKPPKDSIRMNINVPIAFYKEIQHRAIDEGMTVTELVIKAIKNLPSKKKD